jgi:hypothetical protein
MATLRIEYATHDGVQELIDVLTYCAESISSNFEHWDETRTRGPGLYFAVVADHEYGNFADPMGANEWPIGDCRLVNPDDEFYRATRTVAFQNDGAVIVSVDGVVQEQMVRLRDLDRAEIEDGTAIEYEDWMGSRHMSALETSVRESVVGTVTLSEEAGRVSVFSGGNVRTYQRGELGGRWRSE